VDAFLSETNYKFDKLIIDGGVARNDFILQLIADLTGEMEIS
jgi:glycerol kinase